MAVSSAGAGVALDTFQMRGSWEATPWSAFLAAKLLNSFSFSLGSSFEGLNYLGFHEDSPVGFLLVCHIPPTKKTRGFSCTWEDSPSGLDVTSMACFSHLSMQVVWWQLV